MFFRALEIVRQNLPLLLALPQPEPEFDGIVKKRGKHDGAADQDFMLLHKRDQGVVNLIRNQRVHLGESHGLFYK